jgi:hypothetical protein
MSRRIPFGGLAALVVILGITATLTAGYASGAKPGSRNHARKLASALKECKKDKSSAKRRKCETAAKKEYEPRAKPHEQRPAGTGRATGTTGRAGVSLTTTGPATGTTGTITGTTGTTGTIAGTIDPESTPPADDCPHATLVVHVVAHGGQNQEDQPIRIAGQGMCRGQVELGAAEGTARGSWGLLPGQYEVAALNAPGGSVLTSTTVTLGEYQKLEVTLEIPTANVAR